MLELTDTARVIHNDELIVFKMYEITYDPNKEPLRWTDWDDTVSYGGYIYEPQAVKSTGINQSDDGKIESVTLTIGNANRQIQYYIEQYGLIGKRIKIIEVFCAADGSQKGNIPLQFKISSATAKKDVATFTLSFGFDIFNITIPNRKVYTDFCQWQFKDENCKYAGGHDSCAKTFADCKKKINNLNFGGFPALVRSHIYV